MRSINCKALALLGALFLTGAAVPAPADDACLDFKWDVGKERALFAGPPAELTAGKDSTSAPALAVGRLYALRLAAQDQVAFAAVPGKKAPVAGAYAGLATLKIQAAGSYRIAIDLPLWIDVVSNGALLAPKDFEGQHGCSAPRKIVEFDLAGAQAYLLQFSNAEKDAVRLTVTQSPARKL
jgi:hypothetical protein